MTNHEFELGGNLRSAKCMQNWHKRSSAQRNNKVQFGLPAILVAGLKGKPKGSRRQGSQRLCLAMSERQIRPLCRFNAKVMCFRKVQKVSKSWPLGSHPLEPGDPTHPPATCQRPAAALETGCPPEKPNCEFHEELASGNTCETNVCETLLQGKTRRRGLRFILESLGLKGKSPPRPEREGTGGLGLLQVRKKGPCWGVTLGQAGDKLRTQEFNS